MDEKKTKLAPVRLVGQTGKSALVEWQDKKGVYRAFIPAEKFDDKLDQSLLEAAPAYGVPWADAPIKPFSGDDLQAALYAAGIWTESDLRNRPRVVIGVLQALMASDLGSLVEFAVKYEAKEVK